MPIDPKYFNRFMIITAVVTALVILLSTIRHQQVQQKDYRSEVSALDVRSLTFQRIPGTSTDSLQCSQERKIDTEILRLEKCLDAPVVLMFWATWSGMSLEMNKVALRTVQDFTLQNPSSTAGGQPIILLAASVRDDANNVAGYSHEVNSTTNLMHEGSFPMIFADGTELFHQLKATGIPSQIFIDSDGTVSDLQIGKDPESLRKKILDLLDP